MEEEGKNITYENTYRMTPEQREKFKFNKIEESTQAIVDGIMKDAKSVELECSSLSKKVSDAVISSIVDMINTPKDEKGQDAADGTPVDYRYKVAIQTTVGEIQDQGVRISSRCLWDPQFDMSISVYCNAQGKYCSVIIFCIYFQ
ncbi:hypothetical protein BLNAU_7910 [Blattamonas nauphoetae]|uniref:Uncharacterized protein n=1 Tax=Blattamonas nauphoetae TaxID=2049346 RepID=A0ABQ9Y005_9EUKA|nr:hypothetical protein BLNAU_7910 [Blattamonas nauphoetae]